MIDSIAVQKRILNSLKEASPFSVVRFGDGEASVLRRDCFDHRDHLYKVLINHLGFIPTDDQIEGIRYQLKSSLEQADLIGVPYDQYLTSKNQNWREGIKILQDVVGQSYEPCSMNLHLDFLNQGLIDEILWSVDEVYFVSPHKLDFKSKYKNIKNQYSFQIPPEIKYFPNYKGENHLYYLELVHNWIRGINCKGKLCLVGGGIVGKVYLKWFKDAGGIAVDMGSVFDRWAGRITRGREKKKVYDNTFKL